MVSAKQKLHMVHIWYKYAIQIQPQDLICTWHVIPNHSSLVDGLMWCVLAAGGGVEAAAATA